MIMQTYKLRLCRKNSGQDLDTAAKCDEAKDSNRLESSGEMLYQYLGAPACM